MNFGICTSVENAALMARDGWDYVEGGAYSLLSAQQSDADWNGLASTRGAALPVLAANGLVPGSLKITGENVDEEALARYMETACARAAQIGIEILVFGSGGARNIPDGFSRDAPQKQILAFLRRSAQSLERHGVTMAIEPLNRKECNVLNSVGEAMDYIEEVNHPRVRCLVDSFHFWLENESLDSIARAGSWMAHVHVSDANRLPVGEGNGGDYRAFFDALKKIDYGGKISVEADGLDVPQQSARMLPFLKKQWDAA